MLASVNIGYADRQLGSEVELVIGEFQGEACHAE